jgi:subtilase family serine protease
MTRQSRLSGRREQFMRVAGLAAGAVGALCLVMAASAAPRLAAPDPGAAGPAATGTDAADAAGTAAAGSGTTDAAAALAGVVVRPGAVRVGQARAAQAGPPSTADCQKEYKVACYGPAQVQQAYHLGPLYAQKVTGKGTTIVIIDSYGSPTIKNDLTVFDRAYKLAAPPKFQVIQPVGKVPAYDPANSDMVGWAAETTLDVEWAHAVAPGANILLVETPVAETEGVHGFPQIVAAEKYVLQHHLGTVISQSFGATEATFANAKAVQALRGAYGLAYADHVTVLAASGDSGVANLGLDQTTYYSFPVASWPASDPLVTGVGGTELHFSAKGTPQAQTAWNDTTSAAANELTAGDAGPNPLASGGGLSMFFARPAYQQGVPKVVGGKRGLPDVSMSASCSGSVTTYGTFGGAPAGWTLTCGTSEATPLFAGIVALADQVAGHSLGLVNPALYQLAAQHAAGIVPITSGNNTVSFVQGGRKQTVTGYSAHAGYNLDTGVGTINAQYFVPELARLGEK